jgi:hypothetical protein
MHSIVDRECWQTGKPASRPTTSERKSFWIALVAAEIARHPASTITCSRQ